MPTSNELAPEDDNNLAALNDPAIVDAACEGAPGLSGPAVVETLVEAGICCDDVGTSKDYSAAASAAVERVTDGLVGEKNGDESCVRSNRPVTERAVSDEMVFSGPSAGTCELGSSYDAPSCVDGSNGSDVATALGSLVVEQRNRRMLFGESKERQPSEKLGANDVLSTTRTVSLDLHQEEAALKFQIDADFVYFAIAHADGLANSCGVPQKLAEEFKSVVVEQQRIVESRSDCFKKTALQSAVLTIRAHYAVLEEICQKEQRAGKRPRSLQDSSAQVLGNDGPRDVHQTFPTACDPQKRARIVSASCSPLYVAHHDHELSAGTGQEDPSFDDETILALMAPSPVAVDCFGSFQPGPERGEAGPEAANASGSTCILPTTSITCTKEGVKDNYDLRTSGSVNESFDATLHREDIFDFDGGSPNYFKYRELGKVLPRLKTEEVFQRMKKAGIERWWYTEKKTKVRKALYFCNNAHKQAIKKKISGWFPARRAAAQSEEGSRDLLPLSGTTTSSSDGPGLHHFTLEEAALSDDLDDVSCISFDLGFSDSDDIPNSREQTQDLFCKGAATEPLEMDVLCGRGGKTNNWPGNAAYWEKAKKLRPSYQQAPSNSAKNEIAQNLVNWVKGRSGRFIYKDQTDGQWYQVSDDVALNKVKQFLRAS